MTTEEKAKAYDNALKRIREFYLEYDNISNLIDVKRELESIFPQLCESEDEQTRRRLIEFISDIKEISESGRNSWAIRKEDAEMCNAFLSYLEKQKPTEVVKDQRQIAFMIEDGRRCGVIEGKRQVIDNPEKYGLQKHTEWSEKDERMIDKICHAILVSTYHKDGLTLSEMNQCQAWMHNLSQKAIPSNERDRWLISRALEYVNMSNENDELKKEIEVCLKRRQPQSHWKPSKEEMEALDMACSGKLWYGDIYLEGLKRIREQLKKL